MWVRHSALYTAAGPPTEEAVAAALRGALGGGPEPVMVVDGRAADARGHTTSTYRLLAALGLVHAAPVCCWSRAARHAWDVLDLLLDTVDREATALVVAASATPPFLWGAVALSRTPHPTAGGDRLLTRQPAHGHARHDSNGFLQLVAAVEADRDREN